MTASLHRREEAARQLGETELAIFIGTAAVFADKRKAVKANPVS